jgi:hypothetical protein
MAFTLCPRRFRCADPVLYFPNQGVPLPRQVVGYLIYPVTNFVIQALSQRVFEEIGKWRQGIIQSALVLALESGGGRYTNW